MEAPSQGTIFPSPTAFIHYFREHDELPIPADSPLVVQNISILRDRTNKFERDEKFPEDPIQKIVVMLNKMGQVLAKTFIFSLSEDNCLAHYSIGDENLSIQCRVHAILKTEKGIIYTRISDLFRLMVVASIFKVEFDDDQLIAICGD